MIGIRLQVNSTCRDEAGAWPGRHTPLCIANQIKSNRGRRQFMQLVGRVRLAVGWRAFEGKGAQWGEVDGTKRRAALLT
jgi:hypothetical protein